MLSDMNDENKTRDELLNELKELRLRVAALEASEKRHRLTERALHESEKRFNDVAENALEWIWEVDLTGRYTYVSPVVENILGYKPEELIGHHFYDLFHPDDRDELKELAFNVFSQKLPFRELVNRNIHKQGHTVWLSTSGMPILDEHGALAGYRGADSDITARKQAEDALKATSEQIKRFAYSISHDLKNPSLVLNMLAKKLSDKYGDLLDQKGREYCSSILEVSEEVMSLVDNINFFITAKETPQDITRIDMKDICTTVKKEFSGRLKARGIKWSETGYMPVIYADRISFLRILRNFVDNALKYGGETLSEIYIGYSETDDHHILSVKDDGIGLTEADIGDVFDLFKRKATAKGVSGSGLGLAIVKEIAEKFNGRVWAEPGKECGVTFFVSISKRL